MLFPVSLFLSCRWIVRPANCTALSGIAGWSQVSVRIITQQSLTKLSGIEVIHFGNDGSYICKKDTWQWELVWVLL